MIDRFGIKLKIIPLILIYALPVAITVLLCATTPWTYLMFRVDESGNVLTMEFIFVFGAIAPFLYWLQLLLLGDGADVYETTSIPVSLALVYLVTNVSTHSLFENPRQGGGYRG